MVKPKVVTLPNRKPFSTEDSEKVAINILVVTLPNRKPFSTNEKCQDFGTVVYVVTLPNRKPFSTFTPTK